MHLEIVEVLALAGEGAGSQYWSRSTARPRYSLGTHDVAARHFVHSFTCFDVAERVETDYDIVFAGRVSYSSSKGLRLFFVTETWTSYDNNRTTECTTNVCCLDSRL